MPRNLLHTNDKENSHLCSNMASSKLRQNSEIKNKKILRRKVLTESDLSIRDNYQNMNEDFQYNRIDCGNGDEDRYQSHGEFSSSRKYHQRDCHYRERKNDCYVKMTEENGADGHNQKQLYPTKPRHQQSKKFDSYKYEELESLQIKYYNGEEKVLNELIDSFIEYRGISSLDKLLQVKKLEISCCGLESLDGLEHFYCLEELRLCNNRLMEVEELYRIKNKERLKVLNLRGNDIEYFYEASWGRISKVFPNLEELNEKSYVRSRYEKESKRRGKKGQSSMRAVLKKEAKLEYEMRKALRKEKRKTDLAILKLHGEKNHMIGPLNPATKYSKQTQQQVYESEHEYQREEQTANQVTERTEKKSSYSQSNVQNHQFQRQREAQAQIITSRNRQRALQNDDKSPSRQERTHSPGLPISLDQIENVPLTRSIDVAAKSEENVYRSTASKETVRRRLASESEQQNCSNNKQRNISESQVLPLQQRTIPIRNLLEIEIPADGQQLVQGGDENVDRSNITREGVNFAHLHQPTATFAMQKEKELKCLEQNRQFMFKKSTKGPAVKNIPPTLEESEHFDRMKTLPSSNVNHNVSRKGLQKSKTYNNYEGKKPTTKTGFNNESLMMDGSVMAMAVPEQQNEPQLDYSRISRLSEIPKKGGHQKFNHKVKGSHGNVRKQTMPHDGEPDYNRQYETYGDEDYVLEEGYGDDRFAEEEMMGEAEFSYENSFSYIQNLSAYNPQKSRKPRASDASYSTLSRASKGGRCNRRQTDRDYQENTEDEDSILRNPYEKLESEMEGFAMASYFRGLLSKGFDGLIYEANKRRNMPRRKVFTAY